MKKIKENMEKKHANDLIFKASTGLVIHLQCISLLYHRKCFITLVHVESHLVLILNIDIWILCKTEFFF